MIGVNHEQHDDFEEVQALARANVAARAFSISVDFSPKRLHPLRPLGAVGGAAPRPDPEIGPDPAEKLALLDRASGSENFGANPQGILDGGQANAAGGSVNQNPLASLQSG